MFPLSPVTRLLAAGTVCLVGCVGAVWLVAQQPWLGLRLEQDLATSHLRVVGAAGPSAEVPVGATLLSIAAQARPGEAVGLLPSDLVEDPDQFDTWPQMAEFFARQTRMARALRSGAVRLELEAGGERRIVSVTPLDHRPLATLPGVFWFQLLAGSVGLVIGCWVLVLRPKDPAVRAFAVMGASFPLFTTPAAIYSVRELALDGTLFRALASLNHTGALAFGCGLVALFLCHPRPLVAPRWLWVLPALAVPSLASDVFRFAPNQDLGSRIPIAAEMLTAIGLGLVQWRVTRGDPMARAALRWLGLSVLVGSGLFVFTMVGAGLLGWFPPIPQGYAFGFFLVMDAGMALGLRRYRLFALDEWAYRVLLWVGGALTLLALDAGLVLWLRLDGAVSLGVALLVCGFVYLPVRNWLWGKVVLRGRAEDPALFQSVLEVAFAVTPEQGQARWRAVLQRLFSPLTIEPWTGPPPAAVQTERDGLTLVLPPVGALPALAVSYPSQGRALFGPRQARQASELVAMLRHASDSRAAYDRGVSEERLRIARDLHDDVGARLLSGLDQPDLAQARHAMREAISDMREMLKALTGQQVSIDEALADLRHETARRVEAAGIALDWALSDLLRGQSLRSDHYRHYLSMMREAISNVIKHSGARRVQVAVGHSDGWFTTTVRDDGRGLANEGRDGHGLANLEQRAQALGGVAKVTSGGTGTVVELRLPLAPVLAPPEVPAAKERRA